MKQKNGKFADSFCFLWKVPRFLSFVGFLNSFFKILLQLFLKDKHYHVFVGYPQTRTDKKWVWIFEGKLWIRDILCVNIVHSSFWMNPTLTWFESIWQLNWIIASPWRHKSKIPEKMSRCGRQNMLWLYLKIWEREWIFGLAVKAISSPGVPSPCFYRYNRHCHRWCSFQHSLGQPHTRGLTASIGIKPVYWLPAARLQLHTKGHLILKCPFGVFNRQGK